MISPRFLFAALVCIPCLLIDDMVRVDALAGQFSTSGLVFSSEPSDSQVLEERKNLDFVFQFTEDIQHFAQVESPFQCDLIDQVSFICEVADGPLRSNPAEHAVSVQHFTSRNKPDAEQLDVAWSVSSVTRGIHTLFTTPPVLPPLVSDFFPGCSFVPAILIHLHIIEPARSEYCLFRCSSLPIEFQWSRIL